MILYVAKVYNPNISLAVQKLFDAGIFALAALILYITVKITLNLLEKRKETIRIRRARLLGLNNMHPTDFEKLVCDMFECEGYEAKHTGKTGDHGIDAQLKKGGKKFAVQMKRYEPKYKIPEKHLREFLGSYVRWADEGFYVTTSDFTKDAKKWAAKELSLHLIDGTQLIDKLGKLPV